MKSKIKNPSNSRFIEVLKSLVPFAMLAVGILSLYYANREKKTALEVKKICDVELTRPLNVEKLSSTYIYDSIRVEHLWQTSYTIRNIGDVAIYGGEFDHKRNINGNSLKFQIKNCDKLLSIDITDTNAEISLINDSSLKFAQWRPNEYVELVLLSDGEEAPELTIRDRDIEDAIISYVKYSPEDQFGRKRLMDRLPKRIYTQVAWWITIVLYGFFLWCSKI